MGPRISLLASRLAVVVMAMNSASVAALVSAPSELSTPLESPSQGDQPLKQRSHPNQPQESPDADQFGGALSYLQRYGYMSPIDQAAQAHTRPDAAHKLVSEESFGEAVRRFQRFAGLNESGSVDAQTLRFMQMPRCGNADLSPPTSGAHLPANDDWANRFRQSAQASASLLPINAVQLPQPAGPKLTLDTIHRQPPRHHRSRRRKRYALQGSKWRRQELTYRISQYPTRFNGRRAEVDAQIDKAFSIWSQVAPINFLPKREGRVHIDIRFASGDHGDGDAFDGPGNTLAHAYFPQYGGDAHFDDQEYWTVDSFAGTNIFQVAAHELGHSLGLGHSNVREALMAPFYQKYKPNFRLHADDVLAIQALYGELALHRPATEAKEAGSGSKELPLEPAGQPDSWPGSSSTSTSTSTTTSTTTTATPPTPGLRETNESDVESTGAEPTPAAPPPADTELGPQASRPAAADLCSDPQVDAVTRTEDGNTYVFRGHHYWLLNNEGLASGYPRPISADWAGLGAGPIDAALSWPDGKTFLFRGNKYWRFRNRRPDAGYPKPISAGFAGIPDNIDAAFVWAGNGRTYVFKGAEYWRFDSKSEPPVGPEYPRSTKVWAGVPAHVDAAFRWHNNVTYFFKANQYYRFNDKDFRVESRGKPPFPRNTAEWWFGCGNTNHLAQRAAPPSAPSPPPQLRGRELLFPEQGAESGPDWSFYAGLDEATRLAGTYISDQRPPAGAEPDWSPAGGARRIGFGGAQARSAAHAGAPADCTRLAWLALTGALATLLASQAGSRRRQLGGLPRSAGGFNT